MRKCVAVDLGTKHWLPMHCESELDWICKIPKGVCLDVYSSEECVCVYMYVCMCVLLHLRGVCVCVSQSGHGEKNMHINTSKFTLNVIFLKRMLIWS